MRNEVDAFQYVAETNKLLKGGGLLLVSEGDEGKPNAMTIGWGTIGVIWGQPMFVVLVRPSRYTYRLLEENGDFTVNMMPDAMVDIMIHCGTVSGRDEDKFSEQGLTALPALHVKTPIVGESLIAYECRTMMKNEVLPETLDSTIRDSAYPSGDLHRLYFGKILGVQADKGIL